MTEMTHYPPIASSWPQDGTATPGPVLVTVASPAAQRRATVAVRLILAVPHLLALWLLGIAAFPVAVIGWLGALVTGRLPRFAATYLSGYLQWYARAGAYLLLLTDQYPPFTLGDAAYPVRLAVGSGKLNRLSVLFRVILAIPVAIVAMLVNSGLAIIVIVAGWPTALIAGRLPAPLHQAFAAILRYAVRYLGYLYLLTGTYPAGMFGDEPAPQAAAWPQANGPQATAWPQAYSPQATAWPQANDPQATAWPQANSPQATAWPQANDPQATAWPQANGPQATAWPQANGPQATAWPQATPQAKGYGQDGSGRLVLSSGAKRLVGLILVLGLLTAAGEGAWAGVKINAIRQRDREISQLNVAVAQFNQVVARHNAAVTKEQQAVAQASKASQVLSTAHDTLYAALNSPAADASNCSTVSCFDETSVPCMKGFVAFGRTLSETPVPPGSAAIDKRLIKETAGNEADWREMTVATSFTSIEDEATAAEKVGGQFDSDYQKLITSFGDELTTLSDEAVTLSNEATTLNRQGAALTRQAEALNVTVGVRTANLGS